MAKTSRNDREARERLRLYTARQTVHRNRISRRRRDNIVAIIASVVVITLAVVLQVVYFTAGPGAPEAAPDSSAAPEPTSPTVIGSVASPEEAENRTWSGQLVLNEVELDIELDGAAAPQATAAFLQNTRDGYFIDKNCHRLTDDGFHVLQCGSIDGRGGADPSYMFGPIENAPADDTYPAGTIAMARAGGNPDSNGRQFFIVYDDTVIPSDAAGGYTVFGRVTAGLDELREQITDAGVIPGTAPNDGAPVVPTVISRVELN